MKSVAENTYRDERDAKVFALYEQLLEIEQRLIPTGLHVFGRASSAGEKIDLLKIDVEKGELEVLNGIEDADWPRIHQIVMEVHDLDGRVGMVR